MINFIIPFIFCASPLLTSAQTFLRADGTTDTYTLINKVLGGTAVEVPDCAHNQKHITQENDSSLNKQVFLFHAHVKNDNDRCSVFDRQRTEIKTNLDNLNGKKDETVSMSWNFKLDKGFQPSTAFTHIHQAKAVGGNDGHPIITITPRKTSSGNILEIIHIDNKGTTTHLEKTPLAPFLGTWIHVTVQNTYSRSNGRHSVVFARLDNGQKLWSVERKNIDMWRDQASFVRGKWGIYRSLGDKINLRDEIVRFNDFCIAKGSNKCN